MRCLVNLTCGGLLLTCSVAVSNPPRQAPPPQTTVREIPGTPDRIIPGTPGVRITETRELIPPPPPVVESRPVKTYREAPAYYEAPTYYAPPVRYAAPTYYAAPVYAAPVVTYRAAPVYVAPAYAVYGKTPVATTYGPLGGLRTVDYADGTQRRRGLVQRTVGFFIGD